MTIQQPSNNYHIQSDLVHDKIFSGIKNYTFLHCWHCNMQDSLHADLQITFKQNPKLIISFLEQLQHDLLPSIIVTSSQVRVGMLLPLLLCCISDLGPEGLRQGGATQTPAQRQSQLVLSVHQNNGTSERKSRNSAMWSSRTTILSDIMRKWHPDPPSSSLGCNKDPLNFGCHFPNN